MKLSAEPPVGAGIVLVRQTPDGAYAWASGSTATQRPVAGTADDESLAHLAALEAFLDHIDHVGRRLTLDVEDTPAGRALAGFVAEHLPQIPVTAREDLSADEGRLFADIWAALSDLLKPTPPPLERIVAAINGSQRTGQPEAGWAWVTNDGRWETGTIRNRKPLAVEVIALLQLVAAHPGVGSIHIGCDSKQAIATIQKIRAGHIGIASTMKELKLLHPRYEAMFEALIGHQADITFQWVPVRDGQLLTETAHRLAAHARLALQSGMDARTYIDLEKSIISDLRDNLPSQQ